MNKHLISIAPMMDWTDRHYRNFMRLLTKHVLLYTEMVVTGAIIHGDRHRFLKFSPIENPIALQLGGSAPKDLAQCSKIGEEYGYDEINLNVGCPSDRVQAGRFGVCLMKEPKLVAECIAAMQQAVEIPVTVKTRIGVDECDSYEELCHFIETVARTGCEVFIIHARKAWLKGLSPKENRNIPPLRHELVHKLKQDFPQLQIIINGGIKDLKTMREQHINVDGVMIGREAYQNPYLFAHVDHHFYDDEHPILTREQCIQAFIPYIQDQLSKGVRFSNISRHLLGLYQGQPGAKAWRRYISENAFATGADHQVLINAIKYADQAQSNSDGK